MSLRETSTGIADKGMPPDATSLAAAVRAGRIGAAEAMEAAIGAAERHAGFGALNRLDAEMGRAGARALDARRATSRDALAAMPFAGVPFLAKDLGSSFAGIPVHAGSGALARRLGPPKADSELAARFRRSGLLPFGRTSVPEFGLSLASEPAAFPPVRNPLDPSRTAGGSSGGAAAAVALGLVPLAHATDAGGSIRVPAACCGLVGLKPSRGAVPEGPDFANHLAGLACELVIARSVRDVRASLTAVAGRTEGPMPDVAFAEPRRPLRLGLVEVPASVLDQDARGEAVLAAARHLEACGHRVESLPAMEFAELAARAWGVFDAVVSVALASLFARLEIGDDEVEPLSAAVARRGSQMSGREVFEAMQRALLVAHGAARLFRRFDAILAPMLAAAPPPLGAFPTSETIAENQWRRMARFAPTAALANVAGLPAVTVPFGADAGGLPLPVQIIGPIGADPVLLDLAETLSRERPFAHRFPLAGHP